MCLLCLSFFMFLVLPSFMLFVRFSLSFLTVFFLCLLFLFFKNLFLSSFFFFKGLGLLLLFLSVFLFHLLLNLFFFPFKFLCIDRIGFTLFDDYLLFFDSCLPGFDFLLDLLNKYLFFLRWHFICFFLFQSLNFFSPSFFHLLGNLELLFLLFKFEL